MRPSWWPSSDGTRSGPAGALLGELIRTSAPALRAHHERVSAMSWALADLLGLDEQRALLIGVAGWLHDIGMVLVPADDAGAQAPDGHDAIRKHCAWGHEILAMTGDPELGVAAVAALQHHERWDGSGYPNHLQGEEIAVEARIVALCSAYDALRRATRQGPRLGHAEAVALLLRRNPRTGQRAFDPELCALLAANRARFAPIAANIQTALDPMRSALAARGLSGGDPSAERAAR
jgi:HD-GYP domain-containing protein (c-di-GMP phosphodiesterase class II)